jgi:hypothetical protein
LDSQRFNCTSVAASVAISAISGATSFHFHSRHSIL